MYTNIHTTTHARAKQKPGCRSSGTGCGSSNPRPSQTCMACWKCGNPAAPVCACVYMHIHICTDNLYDWDPTPLGYHRGFITHILGWLHTSPRFKASWWLRSTPSRQKGSTVYSDSVYACFTTYVTHLQALLILLAEVTAKGQHCIHVCTYIDIWIYTSLS